MITLRLRHIILFTFASLLTACQFEDNQECPGDNVKANYINLTIAVSNGEARGTRANAPAGGENGDGREAGFERENAITGITLILYQSATGINDAGNPTIDFVAYYPVSRTTKDANTRIEATYETGNQLVPHNTIDFTKTYHAIVVANADLTGSITTSSTLDDVRNMTLTTIYSGNETQPAQQCVGFVMSSEQDNTINFGSVTGKNLDGTTHTPGQDIYYDLTSQPVVIERLAARIDFWSKNSNGYKTSTDNPSYTIPGYEYDVTSSTDKFVVTGIVPFNLVNGITGYGREYLIKRLRSDITEVSTSSYLASEDVNPYVIDPKTIEKVTATTPSLTSSLGNVYDLIGSSKLASTTDNPYYHSVEAMHSSSSRSDIDSKENVVVAYPMENCLLPESKLYYHATGIAIIGYYYVNGTGTGTPYYYIGYLRHHGEAENYNIQPYTSPLSTVASMGTTTPMNFGIVRNNIYRVSINSIDSKGSLELSIKVKKWDPYIHEYIYM